MQPCTLEAYAEAKKLPVSFRRELGLSDVTYMRTAAVRILYKDSDSEERAVRFRLALEKSLESDDRFRWRNDSKPILYGLWRIH